MQSLHFEHETRHNKTNILITIVALCTLILIGLGCSQALKQGGADNPARSVSDTEAHAPSDI